MTAQRDNSDVVMLEVQPQLFVTDLARALAFYVERLGFGVAFQYGEPPFYAQVRRGGAVLNLRHSEHRPHDPAFLAAEEDVLAATVVVDGVGALASEMEAAGADFHQALRNEPWGAQTFIVRDPDGNLICFAS